MYVYVKQIRRHQPAASTRAYTRTQQASTSVDGSPRPARALTLCLLHFY